MPTTPAKKSNDHRFCAALSYVSILFFIPLFFYKDSAFAQFHAKQGLALFLLEIFTIILALIAVLWWLAFILYFFCILASLYGFFMAVIGKEFSIPGVARVVHFLNI